MRNLPPKTISKNNLCVWNSKSGELAVQAKFTLHPQQESVPPVKIPTRLLFAVESHPHVIGARVAHYEITSKLGQGGTGEVYRASDSKLGRDIAIKVVPESFAPNTDRFEREAKTLVD